MLIDLLSTSNQISFNRIAAKTFGLEAAVYLTEIISINEKAMRKGKIYNNYFTVDRDYICNRTTITPAAQLKIDLALSKVKIITVNPVNVNQINIDLNMYANVLSAEIGEVNVQKIKSIAKQRTPEEKQESKKSESKYLAQKMLNTANPELRQAYCNWIDVIVEKYGFLSQAKVDENQKLLNTYAPNNINLQINIINMAASRAWADMKWAICNCPAQNQVGVRDMNKFNPMDTSGEIF